MLEGGVRGDSNRAPLHLDQEWFEAFKILYNNPKRKSGTRNLINDLIREGGSPFWKLEDVVENKNK